jgi:hypothetical protein
MMVLGFSSRASYIARCVLFFERGVFGWASL